MKHPSEIQLALFAGGDLGGLDRWSVGRHVSRCDGCQSEVKQLQSASSDVRAMAADLPKHVNWDRLAGDMTGNIRVGLAAGKAIAAFDKPREARTPRLAWNAAMVLAGATVVFGLGFWINLPQPQADHLWTALKRIRTERIGRTVHSATPVIAAAQDGVVLETSSSSIQVKENGRAMSWVRPQSEGVTVSVSLRGSAAVRYVDADTGQVTTNKVYYAEQ